MARLEDCYPVVFMTAFAEHAVQAFEQTAGDYLLKPVTEERLAVTLERLRMLQKTQSNKPGGPFRYPV